MKNPLLLLFALGSLAASAQEFTIRSVELTETQVVIRYDLLDTARERTYNVFLYSSHDNFLAPLTKVSGDIDLEVRPGANKKIVWDAKAELGATFAGEVELEIRGRVFIPFIRLIDFDKVTAHKRGVPVFVKWSGGTRQNILDFRLYRGEKLVHTFQNAPNNQEYKIAFDKKTRPGKNYYLKISDTKNKDQSIRSAPFAIKRKYPLAAKVIVGAGLAFLILSLIDNPPPPHAELDAPYPVPGSKN